MFEFGWLSKRCQYFGYVFNFMHEEMNPFVRLRFPATDKPVKLIKNQLINL